MANKLKQLERLVGRWSTTGLTHDEQPLHLTAEDTYEWLEGGGFLLHRVSGTLGSDDLSSIEMIGVDEKSGGFAMYSFDSSGKTTVMAMIIQGDLWMISGKQLKFSGTIHDTEIKGTWEKQGENGDWTPWMDIVLRRDMTK